MEFTERVKKNNINHWHKMTHTVLFLYKNFPNSRNNKMAARESDSAARRASRRPTDPNEANCQTGSAYLCCPRARVWVPCRNEPKASMDNEQRDWLTASVE